VEFLKKHFRSPLVGFVDARRGGMVSGWARSTRADLPVTVDVFADGQLIGSAVADQYRADLQSESPHGCCAFEYALPQELRDGAEHMIEVRPHGGAKPLTNGRFVFRRHPEDFYAGMIRAILNRGLWALAGSISHGSVRIAGWYIPPPGPPDHRITINGQPVALQLKKGTADWKSPLPPDLTSFSFEGTMPLDPRWDELHISFGSDQPSHPLRDFHYPLFDVAMPGPERRERVAGNDAEFLFNLEGYSVAKKLDVLAERFAGRRLAALGPVLDWGCGCGRTGRFLARSGADLYGADIDADNIRWCAEHIKGTYTAISPNPPTAFADNFFGAIYGISVFTHLDRHYESLWLAELHRIAKPGALLFLSVLGRTAAARDNLLEQVMSGDADGFLDFGRNPGIDAVTQGSAYYRNVFHQPDYITKTWGKYFEILSIEEGIVGNYQDLVVARKRA
jgi:SAM-dependent methyltransferase